MNQKTPITLSFAGTEMLWHSLYYGGTYIATPFSIKLMDKCKQEMNSSTVSVTPLTFDIDKKVVYLSLSLFADPCTHPAITQLFFRETLRCLLQQYQSRLINQKHNANNNIFFKRMVKHLNKTISFIDDYYDLKKTGRKTGEIYQLKWDIGHMLTKITEYLYLNRHRADISIIPKQLELYHVFVGLTLLFHKIMAIPRASQSIITELFDTTNMCFISVEKETKMIKKAKKDDMEDTQQMLTVNQLMNQTQNLVISGIVVSDGIDSITVKLDQGKKTVTASSKLIVSPELTSFMAKSQERAILADSKRQLAETAQKLGISIDELKKLI